MKKAIDTYALPKGVEFVGVDNISSKKLFNILSFGGMWISKHLQPLIFVNQEGRPFFPFKEGADGVVQMQTEVQPVAVKETGKGAVAGGDITYTYEIPKQGRLLSLTAVFTTAPLSGSLILTDSADVRIGVLQDTPDTIDGTSLTYPAPYTTSPLIDGWIHVEEGDKVVISGIGNQLGPDTMTVLVRYREEGA